VSELASTVSLLLYLPLLASRPPRMSPSLWKSLDIPFYRCKEIVRLYNGGVAMC
jgi:hypothetical protein